MGLKRKVLVRIPKGGGGSITLDDVPTKGSQNPVKSGGVFDALELCATKQDLYGLTDIPALPVDDEHKTTQDYQAGSIFKEEIVPEDASQPSSVLYYVAITDGVEGTSIYEFSKFIFCSNSVMAIYQSMQHSKVSFSESLELANTQKKQARQNIGINLESILDRIDALEQKVDPKPAPKPAYTVVTTKPTQATIADMVDPTAEKPTEAITVDMTSLTKPTMCYLTYPQEWEVVVDDIIQIPYMVDSNGFEIGATFDAETPLLTTGGVVYRVLDIRLGKGVYKLNFKR